MTVYPEQRRASIIDAAMRILDRDGADALNMRALAGETQLRPTVLYATFAVKLGAAAGMSDI